MKSMQMPITNIELKLQCQVPEITVAVIVNCHEVI
jgi:hypothetical protein